MVKRMGSNENGNATANDSGNDSLNYNSLIEKITENGDCVILGNKGTCKTTLLKHLTRQLRTDSKNHVIVFETFPKWIHEFDSIPYMVIPDSAVQPKENLPYMQESVSYIQWSKDYTITNAETVLEFIKENKDCLFLIECEDMEKISAFMTFVIYSIYRKQYQRAYYDRLEKVNEIFWFMVEESHNLLDSSTVQKKTFQKLRKIQNEFRNLKMHMVCVALRLQDMNPKIRSKMSIILGRVSLDDYQLKVRNLLRNSQYRDVITQLPKGQFVFPELDLLLYTEPFNQQGTPYEWKPEPKEQPKPEPKPEPKTLMGKLRKWFRKEEAHKRYMKALMPQSIANSNSENLDQSVYSDDPTATQDNFDLPEDQALLEEKDQLW